MKNSAKIFFLILFLVQLSSFAGDKKATNPLLQNFNEVIPFVDLRQTMMLELIIVVMILRMTIILREVKSGV